MSQSTTAPKRPRGDSAGYSAVGQEEGQEPYADNEAGTSSPPEEAAPRYHVHRGHRNTVVALTGCILLLLASNVYLSLPYAFSRKPHSSHDPKVPQYFQTSPALWAGPTATGKPAFLAQTREVDAGATFVPNEPLQTGMPIQGMKDEDQSIFRMMGYLSPYAPAPGFGVDEYSLPDGAEIVQVQMLSRHGARYPTTGTGVESLGKLIGEKKEKTHFKGPLSFINDWKYELGLETLVARGRQELFESGVLHSYMYGGLYNPKSKIIVRTTTQDRMLKSAENWMAGFFGLEWTKNATIEVIIEEKGFNNSLAGELNCPNAWTKTPRTEAKTTWINTYLKDATDRFNKMTDGFEWTSQDVYDAQTMCPYETVAYGFSKFCDLFTYKEWSGFGYSIDLAFSSTNAFNSPVGRAIGLGYQQEVLARLKNHTLGYSGSQINTTLDSSTETFPLNQTLYFDFSHDTNIVSILTAFGLRQFADDLPADRYPGAHNFTVAHVTPFGARLDMEIIKSPKPVSPARDGFVAGGETKYIHFVLNQRTLPLGYSIPECDASRKDGWCELGAFIKAQEKMSKRAKFDYSCFGDYPAEKYGKVTDGVPSA